ncbi:MAG: ribosome alternative rescue factor ArfA [Pseudomonas sp.]|jgi:alternative ribosome-rescue factor|uniref:Alternative ribosome-rescue factor n=1 Tax=Ectopseudomonas guguanensis TaxID=1198456 RepID=A0A1H0XCK8_9GAMM|nr:ribosome alternative rescue factor ArfA [Pseudomonas sp.]WJH58751.1 ribosome alternative rescue factor ArfA [Pseudomonas guguanensis]SDQ00660.1 alternative ribosome-rescue factor [Pseudomonas guguanensis]
MSKKTGKRPNKAKSIIAQPLFRSRQERPQKGKGSYRREASHNWEASCFMGRLAALIAQNPARAC